MLVARDAAIVLLRLSERHRRPPHRHLLVVVQRGPQLGDLVHERGQATYRQGSAGDHHPPFVARLLVRSENPETGPGLDPVEMRIAAACEAAEELGWETADNGRTWRNPKMPAAVLEMVVEGNSFKMIPATTTTTTTMAPPAPPRRTGYGDEPLPDTDPIPQAEADAEPQRGVVACDNSQEQEAPMINKMCSQCDERPRRRGGIICEPCAESNLQASANGEHQGGDLQRRSTTAARAGLYARIDRAFADQPKPNGCEFEVHYDPPLDLLDVDPDVQPVVVAATLHLPGGTAIRRDVAA